MFTFNTIGIIRVQTVISWESPPILGKLGYTLNPRGKGEIMDDQARARKGNIILVMCWLAWIVNYVDRMILPPLLPLIIIELGLSLTEAGLLMSSFMFGYAAMQLPSGFLSDRFGRKIVLSLGMVGYSVTTFLSGISPSFSLLLVCRILTGVFQGTHLSVANALLSDFFPPNRRGRAIGIHESGPNVGATIAVPFATLIGATSGWRNAFITASLPGILMAVLFFVLVPSSSREHDNNARQDSVSRTSFKWKSLLPFIVAFSAYGLANWALYTFVPTYLSTKGIPLVSVGFIFATLPFVGIFSKMFGGTLSDRIGRGKVIVSALMLLGPLMYMLTILKHSAELAVVLGCIGFVLFSFSPVIYANVSDLCDSSQRSRALGTVSAIGNIVGAISPVIVGVIADRTNFETAFVVITIIVLASGCLVALIMKFTSLVPQGRVSVPFDSKETVMER